jgi:peptidoglycan/LPS O-acetylase OafA/YrhL
MASASALPEISSCVPAAAGTTLAELTKAKQQAPARIAAAAGWKTAAGERRTSATAALGLQQRQIRMRIAISIGLLVLLVAVGAYVFEGLTVPDAPVPTYGIVVFTIGVTLLVVIGIGLMGLLFYSNRRGYDEPPHIER